MTPASLWNHDGIPVEYGLDLGAEYGRDETSLPGLGLKHTAASILLSLSGSLLGVQSLSLSWITSAGGSELPCCKQPSGEVQVQPVRNRSCHNHERELGHGCFSSRQALR